MKMIDLDAQTLFKNGYKVFLLHNVEKNVRNICILTLCGHNTSKTCKTYVLLKSIKSSNPLKNAPGM